MKNNTVLSLTIGIPAFNEEKNIRFLLESLKCQKIKGFRLDQVIIVSDASKDSTVYEAKKCEWDKVQMVDRKRRKGLSGTQNEIIDKSKSDILILLDADVLPKNKNFLINMMKPFIKDSLIGVVGADTESIETGTYFEKMLAKSHKIKTSVYRQKNNGNNMYLCHGRARGFSKKLYSKIRFPENCPEDAYSYFSCILHGMKFKYVQNAKVLFRSPSTLSDHISQSKRFQSGNKELLIHFDNSLVTRELHLPLSYYFNSLFYYFLRDPFYSIFYSLFALCVRYLIHTSKVHTTRYDGSRSTKYLRVEGLTS